MVFARTQGDNLTSLVKKIDAASTEQKVNSFVVLLSDEESAPDKLKSLADKNNISKCVLTVDNVTGPQAYNVSKDADVTVVMYNQRKVVVNHAFRAGQLNAAAITKVVADIPKVKQ